MNKHILNRALLNRDALDDNQRKAMFARLGGGSGGGGGWKAAAKRGWDKIKQGVSEMGRLPTPEESLNKLESDAQGRDALIRSALAFTPAGAGVAIDDMMHARKPSDLALASLGALPFVGGLGDDVARGMSAARTPLSKDALLGKFRDALRNIAGDAPDLRRPQIPREPAIQWGPGLPGMKAPQDVFEKNHQNLIKRTAERVGINISDPATVQHLSKAVDRAGGDITRIAPDLTVMPKRSSTIPASHPAFSTTENAIQAKRNELAAALRRDRELKRLDLHPEQFRTTQPFMSASERQLRSAAARNPSAPAAEFGYMGGGTIGERVTRIDREAKAYQAAKATARGHRPGETLALYDNRMPPARSDEERARRAYFARMGGSKATSARGLLDQAGTLRRQATSAASASVVGPNDRNPQPANGFLDWALQEQRPGGPVIQPNPRNPYDTPEARAAQLYQQYTATLPPQVNPHPPGGTAAPATPAQRQWQIDNAAEAVSHFRRRFPGGGDLLGARFMESLKANPNDAGALEGLHQTIRQALERGDWSKDENRLSDVDQARRQGMGTALRLLQSHGMMTDFYSYARRSDGGLNFGRGPQGIGTRYGNIVYPSGPLGQVMKEVYSGSPRQPPSPNPVQRPSPAPTPRPRPAPPGGPGMPIGGPAPVYGNPGTRPIARIPEQRDSQLDPSQRIGGPAPVRRSPTQPASTPKVTASTLQRAVDQFRTW